MATAGTNGRQEPLHHGATWDLAAGALLVLALGCTAFVASVPVARVALVLAGFAAGGALERYRQGHRDRPLSLGETPGLWRARVTGAVNGRYALAAALAAILAVVVLALPSVLFSGDRAMPSASGNAPSPGPGQAPRVAIMPRRLSETFVVHGARFTVFLADRRPWATQLRRTSAGPGSDWITVGVIGTDLVRKRFNPNRLRYRLVDSRGAMYLPDTGGTGPASLARTGYLRRGETAETQLGFRVPKSAVGRELVFEPTGDGTGQVQVRLPTPVSARARCRRGSGC